MEVQHLYTQPKKRLKYKIKDNLFIYSVVISGMVYFIVFFYYPFIKNIVLMFCEYDYINEPKFIGFNNIVKLFHDEMALMSFKNTFFITVFGVPCVVTLAIVIAVGLFNLAKGKSAIRSAIFSTHLTSLIVAAIIFKFWFGDELGFINGLLMSIGAGEIPWLTEPKWAMVCITIVSVWKFLGYFIVIFLAGLSNIDTSLYRASEIDGANSIQKFIHITIPQLRPVIVFSAIIAAINYLRSYPIVVVLTNGGPYRSTETALMYMFDQGFAFRNVGYASVIAIVLFLII